MSSAREQQIAFWSVMSEGLRSGQTLIDTLKKAKDALKGQPLEETVDALVTDIQSPSATSLWSIMAKHPGVFSKCVQVMVRAGEAGGVLDKIAGRILSELKDGIFPVPGEPHDEKTENMRYWRAFGQMLRSGVPVVEQLENIRDEIAGPKLREATNDIINSITNRGGIAEAMARWPECFPRQVCEAVVRGEREGRLDDQAFLIAVAFEQGDMNSIARPEASPQRAKTRKAVNEIILAAVRANASDVHIDFTEDGASRIRMRIAGALRDVAPPQEPLPDVFAELKYMCDLNLEERRVPQDGRLSLNISGQLVDVRLSIVPTVLGERVVMRFFQRGHVRLTLQDIGLAGDDLDKVRKLCALSHGIVMCCGPAGSGKTTLMYAMIKSITRPEVNVMSIEEPVEYHLPDVAQIEINPRAGVTLSRVARAVMRQDPDVIMIGELRDVETVEAAVQMAVTGHLVITQTHADTAPGSARRLIDIGIEPYLVGSSLGGVISQRLVRMLCPQCKQKAKLTPDLLQQATAAQPAVSAFFKSAGDLSMWTPNGCDKCGGSGYRGRVALHEVLIPTERFRSALAASADLADLRKIALEEGMKPMLVNGLEKVAQGITSLVEVLMVVGG